MGDRDRRGQGQVRRPRRPARLDGRRSWSTSTAQESVKQDELRERQALLADASGAPTTPTARRCSRRFLSGGTFTDLLTEMSYYIDVGEQDKALAEQIARDQEALAALHQNVADTRDRTNVLRLETAAQKRALDESLKALKAAKAELRQAREGRSSEDLASQKADLRQDRAQQGERRQGPRGRRAAQRQLAAQDRQAHRPSSPAGQHPVGVQRDARAGRWTAQRHPELRLHRVRVGAAAGRAAPTSTRASTSSPRRARKVRAAATGIVVYIGWNYADGADPAWIVIIAHSDDLQTWYAHMTAGATRAASGRPARSRRARSSATRATPAMRPAPTSTGWSSSTATSSTRACSCRPPAGAPRVTKRSPADAAPFTRHDGAPC